MKVRRVKVVEEIIESLRQDIVTRKLVPGQRMPSERLLSERYGVSQPTVREAIRAPETLGLVYVGHGSGSYISPHGDYGLASALQTLLQLQKVGIIEVLDVRQILGRASVELAAANATSADVERIQQAINRLDVLEEVTTVDEVTRRIIDFQRAVSAAARNPLLHSLEVFLATLLIEVQVTALRSRGVKFGRTCAAEFQADRRNIREGITGSRDRSDGSRLAADVERWHFGVLRAPAPYVNDFPSPSRPLCVSTHLRPPPGIKIPTTWERM